MGPIGRAARIAILVRGGVRIIRPSFLRPIWHYQFAVRSQG